MPTDYEALAKRLGGTTVKSGPVDYNALAAQFGGESVATSQPAGIDFTANPKREGTYTMKGDKGLLRIPYGNVKGAATAGYQMIPEDIERFVRDAKADPTLNSEFKSPGVKVVGKNSAGQNILAPDTDNPEGAWGRFFVNAAGAVKETVKGFKSAIVEGPQNPEEAKWDKYGALTTYRMLVKPMHEQAVEGAKNLNAALNAKTSTERNENLSRGIGHTVATMVPGVGPWAAGVGEQVGAQAGSGDYAGAGGTLAGNAVVYEAPHVLGKVVNAARAVPEGVRNMVGTGAARDLVAKTTENNALIAKTAAENAAKTRIQNEDITASNLSHRGEVDARNSQNLQDNIAKNKEVTAAHAAKVAEINESNAGVLRDIEKRKTTEAQYEQASTLLQNKYRAAEVKANAANDAAWEQVREKTAGQTTDISSLQSTVEAAAKMADPAYSPLFKTILKLDAPTIETPLVVDGKTVSPTDPMYPKYHEMQYGEPPSITPDGVTTNFSRLQRWYTYITDKMYSGGRIEAGSYNALKMVRNAIDAQMQKIAKASDASADLSSARKLHTTKMETFSNSPNEPATVASKSLAEQTPEFIKAQATKKRLDMVANYDPSITKLAEHVNNLRTGLDALPGEAPLRTKLQVPPGPPTIEPAPKPILYNEPAKTKPIEPPQFQKVGPDDIQGAREAKVDKTADWVRYRGRWIATASVVGTALIYELTRGHFTRVGADLLAAGTAMYTTGKLADFIERPAVREWLSKPTRADIQALEKLPAEYRKALTDAWKPILNEASAKGIAVSPLLRAYFVGTAVGPKTQALQDIRDKYAPTTPTVPADPIM